tara:strand:+ start:148 stop:471 length:324 start_codon:yes stop_codon:yes gene_type:complete
LITKTDNNEKIKDPRIPDNVLFGLSLVNLRPLNILPKTYPPISESIVKIIIQIKRKKDEAVSFLKNNNASKEETRIISNNIIVIFLLKTEKTSKFPSIKIAYKNDTI